MTELNIGTRIAELRNAKNITQLDLAEKLGVTDRAVSMFLTFVRISTNVEGG